MYPYFLMLGLPALLGFANRRVQATFGLTVVFLLFVAVIGLRYQIGPDWGSYLNHVRVMPQQSLVDLAQQGEVGWAVLVKFSDYMGWGIHGLAFASGLVFCLGVFSIAKACEAPMLAVVAAVPYLSIAVAMSGMRQAMAIGIVFVMVARWYRDPIWVKIGLVLLATSFHFSAIAMLLIVALDSRLQLLQRIGAGLFVFALMIWQFSTTEFRVNRYSTDYLQESQVSDAAGALYHVALTAVPCIAYFVMRKRWIAVYGRISVVDIFAVIGALSLVLVLIYPTATDRMTLYFSAVALIIQGNFANLWANRSEQFVIRTGIIALNAAAMITFLVFGNKVASFVPYAWVFSHEAQFDLPRPR